MLSSLERVPCASDPSVATTGVWIVRMVSIVRVVWVVQGDVVVIRSGAIWEEMWTRGPEDRTPAVEADGFGSAVWMIGAGGAGEGGKLRSGGRPRSAVRCVGTHRGQSPGGSGGSASLSGSCLEALSMILELLDRIREGSHPTPSASSAAVSLMRPQAG